MVMGRDSRSKGCGFESQHHIQDGHDFTYICCKNCNVCLKRPIINKKEARVGQFLKKIEVFYFRLLWRLAKINIINNNLLITP